MPETPRDELARRLEAYPKSALPFFQRGFAIAAALSPAQRQQVLTNVFANIDRGSRLVDSSSIRAITNLSESESDQITSIYSLLIGLLSETTSAATADFLEAAGGVLFAPENEAVARSIVDSILGLRTEIKASVDRSQLSGVVLPSLFAFDLAIDLRARVVDGQVSTTAPVAVVHIDTDAEGHGIWVQLTPGDVEFLINTLSKARDDLKVIEILGLRKR